MSEIVEWMQEDNTGVPVRCQKIFLTTIPCAFTGSLILFTLDKRWSPKSNVITYWGYLARNCLHSFTLIYKYAISIVHNLIYIQSIAYVIIPIYNFM